MCLISLFDIRYTTHKSTMKMSLTYRDKATEVRAGGANSSVELITQNYLSVDRRCLSCSFIYLFSATWLSSLQFP